MRKGFIGIRVVTPVYVLPPPSRPNGPAVSTQSMTVTYEPVILTGEVLTLAGDGISK